MSSFLVPVLFFIDPYFIFLIYYLQLVFLLALSLSALVGSNNSGAA